MPESPKLPPVPDALRADRPVIRNEPKIDILHDPFNPEPVPSAPKAAKPEEENREEQAETGLAEYDAPHAFASVLASGLGRAAAVVLTCIITFGLTLACHRVSLIGEGWHTGGFGGFFGAIFAVPGSIFSAPGAWFTSLGDGILNPLGVPYLLLLVGGLILAVRSEIHLVKLMFFYALVGAVHAAGYLHMRSFISFLLWLGVLAGCVWLYRWYWRQQLQVEEEAESAEE
jgi:hypothetical protein